MIERQVIAGRPATVAYLTDGFKPTTQDAATLVKVLFDNGDTLWLTPASPAKSASIAKFNENHDELGRFATGDGGGAGGGKAGIGGKSDKPLDDRYSNKAELKNGVIHTSNVDDAVIALTEDRAVQLSQPDEVATLLDKLGAVAQDMQDKGKDAPNFNLCNVSVSGTNLFCADTLGIPRIQMPQMNDAQTHEFRGYLQNKGYEITREEAPASHLRATQNELNGAKVARFMNSLEKGEGHDKRLIVSKDNYVLDGHHHWAATVGVDSKDNKLGNLHMKVARVNVGIVQLLKEARLFGAKTESVNKRAPVAKYNENHDEQGRFAPADFTGDARAGLSEDHAVEPPAVGQSFVVYRAGKAGDTSLAGRNAGSAYAVAHHMATVEDYDKPTYGSAPTDIHAYAVTLTAPTGKYDLMRGKADPAATAVGRGGFGSVDRSGGIRPGYVGYSFHGEGAGYTSRHLGSLPISAFHEHMGGQSFDEMGTLAGGDAIRSIRFAPGAKSARRKYNENHDELGRFSTGDGTGAGKVSGGVQWDKQYAVDVANKLFGKDAKDARAEIDRMALNSAAAMPPGQYEIKVSTDKGERYVRVQIRDANEGTEESDNIAQVQFARDGSGNLTAEIDLLQVRSEQQGQGHGRDVLAAQIDAFNAMGIQKVTLTANLTAGGYVWAQAGFTEANPVWNDLAFENRFGTGKPPGPPPPGRELVTDRMERERPADGSLTKLFPKDHAAIGAAVRSLRKSDPDWLFKTANMTFGGKPIGKKLLAGTDWHASIDLKNPDQVAHLRDFLRGK